jgi:hypothetical protein
MSTHNGRKEKRKMEVKLEYGRSVSLGQLFLVLVVKFILSVLRVLVFPLGLVWVGVHHAVKIVYDKYPGR